MKDFLTFVLILLSNNLHLCFPLIRCLVLKSVSYKIARLLRLRFILLNAKVKVIIATAEVKKTSGYYAKGQNLNKEITGTEVMMRIDVVTINRTY